MQQHSLRQQQQQQFNREPQHSDLTCHWPIIHADAGSETSTLANNSISKLYDRRQSSETQNTAQNQPMAAPGGFPRNGSSFSYIMKAWKWEFSNCFLFVVAIFAILATLYPHNGQRVPDWPFSITINALLSIYALWFKTSVLFVTVSALGQLQWCWYSSERPLIDILRYNEAQSGPWGSFRLLMAHKFKQPLAAFGAIIIIITIAVDPFAQQLVSPTDCSFVLDSDEATIPATTRFDGVASMYEGFNTEAPVGTTTAFPSDFISSILSGLHASSVTPDFHCTTGNCTFADTYRTLGVCAACNDISNELTFSKTCTSYESVYTNGSVSMNTTSSSSMDCQITGITGKSDTTTSLLILPPFAAPYNLSVTFSELQADRQNAQDVFTASFNTSYMNHDGGLVELGNNLVVLLGKTSATNWRPYDSQEIADCNTTSAAQTWPCQGYGAATCQMRPCIREYNATITAGKLGENLVGQTDFYQQWGVGTGIPGLKAANVSGWSGDISQGPSWFGLVDTGCLSQSQRENLTAAGLNTSSRWIPYDVEFPLNVSISKNASFPQSLLETQCLYLFKQGFLVDLWAYLLDELFNGTVSVSGANFNPQSLNSPLNPLPGATGISGPPELVWMYNGGSVNLDQVSAVFQRLAETLTLFVRSNGNADYSDPGKGQTFHYATCIQVHWNWIALPVILSVATILFFALVVASCRERSSLWKASPLALLFHGPAGADWVGNVGEHNLSEVTGMEKMSEGTTVILNQDGRKLEVVQRKDY